MEDLPDKLRRNVIVFSGAIILFFFLKPKLGEKGELFGFQLSSIKPFSAAITVTIVLFYIFLRFHHDKQAQEDREAVRSAFQDDRATTLAKLYRWAFALDMKCDNLYFFQVSRDIKAAKEKYCLENNLEEKEVIHEVEAFPRGVALDGAVHVTLKYVRRGGTGGLGLATEELNSSFPFSPQKCLHRIVGIKSFFSCFFFAYESIG